MDSSYGWTYAACHHDVVAFDEQSGKHQIPPIGDPVSDRVLGVAHVFVVGPLAVERIGGIEVLERDAPVFEVRRVDYQGGDVGAVVRVGRDGAKFVERAAATCDFFRPYFIPRAP